MLTKFSQKFQRKKIQQTAINSANMGKIKIMQWNCRGLSNKISELFVFLKEKYIDIEFLNEVKSWQNENRTDDYFVVTETRARWSHGSMILAKQETTKIEVKPEKLKKKRLRKSFRNSKTWFEVLVLGHLWVIALYNSSGPI